MSFRRHTEYLGKLHSECESLYAPSYSHPRFLSRLPSLLTSRHIPIYRTRDASRVLLTLSRGEVRNLEHKDTFRRQRCPPHRDEISGSGVGSVHGCPDIDGSPPGHIVTPGLSPRPSFPTSLTLLIGSPLFYPSEYRSFWALR